VLASYIRDVAIEAGLELSAIDAISVSKGPGSYTGLRIGVATAKGLCYALDKPLIAVETLRAAGCGMRDTGYGMRDARYGKRPEARGPKPEVLSQLFCPMLDARRMEVYYAIYDTDCNEIKETCAEIIDERSFSDLLKDHVILFAGDGAGKCRDVLKHQPNAMFFDDFALSSRYMIRFAEEKFAGKAFEDLAYFEPFYLKDFIAGKPRVKGLR
jgi:tRNA threonylcarbamoyladenosine biosynthesis protein TsaB